MIKLIILVIISAINPVVQDTAGVINSNLQVGIISSKLLLEDKGQAAAQPISVSPQAYFDYLSTLSYDSQSSGLANIFRDQVEESTLGYVSGTAILRINMQRIMGSGGEGAVDHDHSLRIGAVSINIDDTSSDPIDVIEIRGSDGF